MVLELNTIAAVLEGLEETIISKLIDRAQFRVNRAAYTAGSSGFEGEEGRSLFELRLRYQEEMDARFGRFLVPEERPFTSDLPTPHRRAQLPDTGLGIADWNQVSVASAVLESYLQLLPLMCAPGDDGHYGSSVEHDVYVLQALSRRIHFGALYVAECKYREDPEGYSALVTARDEAALLGKLTRRSVEERIIDRVNEKVAHLQARVNRSVRTCIDPAVVTQFYRDRIIPLTKQSEVLYLLNRAQ
jgi:chorismate mutase